MLNARPVESLAREASLLFRFDDKIVLDELGYSGMLLVSAKSPENRTTEEHISSAALNSVELKKGKDLPRGVNDSLFIQYIMLDKVNEVVERTTKCYQV